MVTVQLPNGPKTHPWLQTLEWLRDPLGYMETCAQEYGDFFTLKIGPLFTPQVFISNPQAIQEIFATDPQQLDAGKSAGVRSLLLGAQSLISLEGQPHQRQRKLLLPPFHGERMRTYGQVMGEITQEVTETWQNDQPFSVLSSMQIISFNVILRTVFGLEKGERYEQIRELLIEIMNPKKPVLLTLTFLFPLLQQDWGDWSPWGHFVRLKQQLDHAIYAEIAERKANFDPNRIDILSMMVAARDEQGQPMTDEEIRDELITLLVAGHETTASSLAWALYWIHRSPMILEKLLQEFAKVDQNGDLNEFTKLPYLNAVCQETLRMYPVAMLAFNRLVKSPLTIQGYQFEPGTLLIPCIYLTHHREDLYPNSKEFKPERFLERQYSPSEFLPFGGGNRRCIGLAFALFEMKIVLATILTQWQMKLASSKPVIPVRRGVLLGPSEGVNMIVKGKRSQSNLVLISHP